MVHDLNGDEIITYTYHNNLYVPRCTNVLNVFLVPQTESCFIDIPVIIPKKGGGNFTGFLTKTGILRKISKLTFCTNSTIEINLNNKYLVSITDRIAKIQEFPSNAYTFESHRNQFLPTSYQHDPKLIEEIAFNDQPDNTISNLINGRVFSAVKESEFEIPGKRLEWLNLNFESYTDLSIKFVFFIILTIIICFSCSICGCICYYCIRHRQQKVHVNNFIQRIPPPPVERAQ